MSKINACRVCLRANVELYSVSKTSYQEIYEKLSGVKVEDSQSETLCYVCLAELRKCVRFAQKAQKSREILSRWSYWGHVVTESSLTSVQSFTYKTTPVEIYSIDGKISPDRTLDVDVSITEIKNEVDETPKNEPKVEVQANPLYLKEESDHDDYEPLKVEFDTEDASNDVKPIIEVLPLQKTRPHKSRVSKQKKDTPKIKKKVKSDCPKVSKTSAPKLKIDKQSSENKHFICDICNKKFLHKMTLIPHMRIHTGERPYPCHLCDYKGREKSGLRIHLRVHTGAKPYKCHLCEFKFSSGQNLKRHLLVHTGEKPFACDICGTRFTQRGSLNTHLRSKHAEDGEEVKTEKEEDKSPKKRKKTDKEPDKKEDKDELDKIKMPRIRRKPEKNFLCHICDFKCWSKNVLLGHINAHNGIKPFACKFCEYKSTWKGPYNAHMRTHTGEKPYLCHICDYKCALKITLDAHLRVHTGEKPFACDLCDYKSTQKTHLRQHKKIHTGEKDFECSMCNYKANYRARLIQHIKSVHKKQFLWNRYSKTATIIDKFD